MIILLNSIALNLIALNQADNNQEGISLSLSANQGVFFSGDSVSSLTSVSTPSSGTHSVTSSTTRSVTSLATRSVAPSSTRSVTPSSTRSVTSSETPSFSEIPTPRTSETVSWPPSPTPSILYPFLVEYSSWGFKKNNYVSFFRNKSNGELRIDVAKFNNLLSIIINTMDNNIAIILDKNNRYNIFIELTPEQIQSLKDRFFNGIVYMRLNAQLTDRGTEEFLTLDLNSGTAVLTESPYRGWQFSNYFRD